MVHPTGPSIQMEGINDLHVETISDALNGKRLDVVISGSIGAVESVRFIRALRRLGARVTPWLTEGGAQFVTPTALSWASGEQVRTSFKGEETHIACKDGVVIAPLSAHFAGNVANGLLGTPAAALVQSYLGQRKPVLAVANMHMSLRQAPAVTRSIEQLQADGVTLITPREEEGKLKFPDPATLADHVAHILNLQDTSPKQIAVTMGTTRGYIDQVRYISNYSSGKLGSLISEELYRYGFATHVIQGPCPHTPRAYSKRVLVETNQDMAAQLQAAIASGADSLVMAASVLDFAPEKPSSGKIKSNDHTSLSVTLAKQDKILAAVKLPGPVVGFKLEVDLDADHAASLAADYLSKYGLTMLVANDLNDVSAEKHRATIFQKVQGKLQSTNIEGKEPLAQAIALHIRQHYHQ